MGEFMKKSENLPCFRFIVVDVYDGEFYVVKTKTRKLTVAYVCPSPSRGLKCVLEYENSVSLKSFTPLPQSPLCAPPVLLVLETDPEISPDLGGHCVSSDRRRKIQIPQNVV